MAAQRITAFSTGFELYTSDADPNGVITPMRVGAICVRNSAGTVALYQCTALPSTWGSVQAAGGWTDAGTVVRLATLSDTVGIGAAAMLGAEKVRMTLEDAVNNAVSDVVVIEHTTTANPAQAGIGAGMIFVTETNTNATMNLARISAIATNPTPGAEASSVAFATRTGGGALTDRWEINAGGSWAAKADNVFSLADPTNRIAGVFSLQFSVYATSGAANPTLLAETQALSFGPGGGTALDCRLTRTGARTLTFDDRAGGSLGTMIVKGVLQTEARRLAANFFLAAGGPVVMNPQNDFVGMNTTTAPQTVTLPSAASVPQGTRVIIKNTAAAVVMNNLVLTPNGTDTIDTVNAPVNLAGNQRMQLVSQNSAGVVGWFSV